MTRGTAVHMRFWGTLAAAFVLASSACAPRDGAGEAHAEHTVTLKGSDTMVVLAQRWAESFMRTHPGVAVQVSGGGSGTGIAALVHGTADIVTSSRPISADERRQLRDSRGRDVSEHTVALDAVGLYVHPSNPVRSIDLDRLALVFRGRITRWSELGGPDAPIVLYGRESSSGTYAYFKEHVLRDLDFAVEMQSLPGTAAVIHAVRSDRNAIGYGGIALARGVRLLGLVDAHGRTTLPTRDNALRGAYPLARPLYVYTLEDAAERRGAGAQLLEWIASPQGQSVVVAAGYYPIAHHEVP